MYTVCIAKIIGLILKLPNLTEITFFQKKCQSHHGVIKVFFSEHMLIKLNSSKSQVSPTPSNTILHFFQTFIISKKLQF